MLTEEKAVLDRHVAAGAAATLNLGQKLGRELRQGDAVLLSGGLGAGKTLLTKGILRAFDFDPDEVTSPSFTLVNLYRTPSADVYHIDLWRIAPDVDAVIAVGLDDIAGQDNSIVIIEWAEKLLITPFTGNIYRVSIDGAGEQPRIITIERESPRS